MAAILKNLAKALGSASAEPLTTTAIRTPKFTIMAASTNSAVLYLGDSAVSSSVGMPIAAGVSQSFSAPSTGRGGPNDYDLSKIYIRGTSSDAVRVIYESNE